MNTCPLKIGTSVECNGYPGTLSRICEWSTSMVEVRLASGTVCVDYNELLRARDEKIYARMWKERNARVARIRRIVAAKRG